MTEEIADKAEAEAAEPQPTTDQHQTAAGEPEAQVSKEADGELPDAGQEVAADGDVLGTADLPADFAEEELNPDAEAPIDEETMQEILQTGQHPAAGITPAEIVAEIEGFHDDFETELEAEVDVEDLARAGDADAGDVDVGGGTDGAEGKGVDGEQEGEGQTKVVTLQEKIAAARQEQQQLLEANDEIQKKARQYLEHRSRGQQGLPRTGARLEQSDARYRSVLKQWHDALEATENVERAHQAQKTDLLQEQLAKSARSKELSVAFRRYKWQLAKTAEHSKSGQKIPASLLKELDYVERQRELELSQVRLKTLRLRLSLRKLERSVKAKEELAEGLHLIDFEQLRIENQSLTEKIEERNEELLKLKKKTTTTLQILTHLKEKVQFMSKESAAASTQQETLERELADKRDTLGRIKAQRDHIRGQLRRLKEQSVYITSAMLIRDMDVQKERKLTLQYQVGALQQQYQEQSTQVQVVKSKLRALAEELNNPMSSLFSPEKARLAAQHMQSQ